MLTTYLPPLMFIIQAFSCTASRSRTRIPTSFNDQSLRLNQLSTVAAVPDVGSYLIRGHFPSLFLAYQSHKPEWTEEQAGLFVGRVELWGPRNI